MAAVLLFAPLSTTFALTADELASFLGVSSWQTSVQLPRESTRRRSSRSGTGSGIPRGVVLSWTSNDTANPAAKLLVIGRKGDNPGFTISTNEMTMGFPFSEPIYGATIINKLPATLGLGDHVLAGEPVGPVTKDRNSVESYKRGHELLRIASMGAGSGRDVFVR